MAKKRKAPHTSGKNRSHKNKKYFLVGIVFALIIFAIFYFIYSNSTNILQPNTQFNPNLKNENPSVEAVNGDIVVNSSGEKTQITNWGYNSDPVLSPDGKKIAYLSKTEETIEDENNDSDKSFYKRASSNNVWVINSDGSDPKKITDHKNFVYRNNLHWLDNNRLLFTDGAQSARIYVVSNGTTQNVLGPIEPVRACLDACGFSIAYFLSPNKKYFVKIFNASSPEKYSALLNTDTLEVKNITYPYNPGYIYNTSNVSFPNNTTMTFKQRITLNDPHNPKTIQFSLDLPTGIITALN